MNYSCRVHVKQWHSGMWVYRDLSKTRSRHRCQFAAHLSCSTPSAGRRGASVDRPGPVASSGSSVPSSAAAPLRRTSCESTNLSPGILASTSSASSSSLPSPTSLNCFQCSDSSSESSLSASVLEPLSDSLLEGARTTTAVCRNCCLPLVGVFQALYLCATGSPVSATECVRACM